MGCLRSYLAVDSVHTFFDCDVKVADASDLLMKVMVDYSINCYINIAVDVYIIDDSDVVVCCLLC